jgi:SSS family solute:Na+ symporter
MERLPTIGAVVLAVYMVVLLTLGVIGWKRSRGTEEDFYLAGRGQGFLVTVMTIMATFFSSAAILGIPGNVYKEGVAFTLFALNVPVIGACVYLFGSRIRRIGQKRRYVTQGDMIADYYGDTPAIRILVALIGFLYVLPYVIMQIKAGGLLSQSMFPDSENAFRIGASALSVVTIIYVLIGGMRSVAWTDVLQGLLMIGGILLAVIATAWSLGGVDGMFEKIRELPPEALAFPGPSGKYLPWVMITICIFASIGSLVQPAQWIRLYAAKDDRTLKRSALVFAIVLPACFLLGIMLVALSGRALFPPEMIDGKMVPHPSVGEFDQIVIVMIKEQLPAMFGAVGLPILGLFLVALIMVAVLAASMSTADSNLHALSAVLTRDVYDRFLRPNSSQKERAWFGRAVIIAVALLALWMVNAGHNNADFEPLKMIAQLMFAAIGFSTQLLPLTLDMLYLRRGTHAGVVSGMIVGVLVIFLFTPFPDLIIGSTAVSKTMNPLKSMFFIGFTGFAANSIVFAVVSSFTRKIAPEHRESFAKDMLS